MEKGVGKNQARDMEDGAEEGKGLMTLPGQCWYICDAERGDPCPGRWW